jgi:hypothetical protein
MKSTSKLFQSALAAFALLTIALTGGCSKKVAVDTAKLEYAFQSAEPATQTSVTEAIDAIDKADYSAALEKLKKVSVDPKLNADQKSNVTAVIQQLDKH